MEAKISVLLADASGDLRLLLRETLESTGEFQVVGETGDGGQVLALVEETHPQLLLLDAMLPVLDGMGVLRQLREREEQPRTIVTLSLIHILQIEDLTAEDLKNYRLEGTEHHLSLIHILNV